MSLENNVPTLESEKLSIAGIRCAACVQLLEYSVGQQEGVRKFTINPLNQRADLQWDPRAIDLKSIIQQIVKLGYAAFPAHQSLTEFQQKERKRALWRLFIAGFAMMQVMMYAFPAYLVPEPSVDGDLTPDIDRLLKLASLVISLPVILFSARPFFENAIRDLRHRHIGMDVPVSLGILLTFFASVWASFFGGAVYFDSAIMFVFLLLGARFIEDIVKGRTNAALQALTQLPRSLVTRLKAYPIDRSTEQIEAASLAAGDVLLIPAGEQIPCDGTVVEGSSECDEALMTGESVPVLKQVGDEVIAGSVNQHSALLVHATKVGKETRLAQLIGMMENASLTKPRWVQIADKHASQFLLMIMVIAVLSGLAWSFIDPSRALWIGISVIVVTCPCALSLATPGVMSAAIGQLAKAGMLLTKGQAIESLAHASHFVFDKTGTLTFGRLRVVAEHVDCRSDLTSKTDSLELSATIQSDIQHKLQLEALLLRVSELSLHPVSKAVHLHLIESSSKSVRDQASQIQIGNFTEVAGAGLQIEYEKRFLRFGRPEYALELSGKMWELPEHAKGKSVTVFADQEGVLAYYVLEDGLRDDAADMVQALRDQGKQVLLLSGDRVDVVSECAAAVGIDDFHAQLQPHQKYELIQHLQQQGAVVVMVGDGMNDGPALSLANVSIAMGQGAPMSQTRSDALLMSNRLMDILYALKISKLSYQLIRENLAWAMLYNLIAIPAAVVGWLEPWHAALGMSLSSLLVVLNGLRVLRLQPPSSNIENGIE
ncbi:cation-translocating P-type ATPase [Undibacterium cyanobacteriorum]|uniref:Cation-translocating P-type ATPase n=1 Tax=Undibacterium cyanobacteriorum TaxID=3073561 RepID=A0ABY9RG32_9BURK|nr:cation-translocating P-type ATPase [Undibacterium sp. 20NA77.5]WMW79197.1 cation-translocating P-type ATPase [Undibacterium sp. 20NA77.5]